MSNPNIAEASLRAGTRFPVNRPAKPHTQKHPHGYLTPKLKKLLKKKKFRCIDPETKQIIQLFGADALIHSYVWEALQGNITAIEGIFDRVDGKAKQDGQGGTSGQKVVVIIERETSGDKSQAGQLPTRVSVEPS